MGRYGTREAEVDDLLRRGVFVDLYKVVKGGLLASVPGYGLKEIEAFLGFDRAARRSRTAAPRSSSTSATSRRATGRSSTRSRPTTRRTASATLALRDWLLGLRGEALATFGPFPLPEPEEPRPTPPAQARARRAAGGAARGGRGARGAAPRLPRPRAQAGLVGVLRPDRADARAADRGRRLDRPARAIGEPEPDEQSLEDPPLHGSRRRSTSCGSGAQPFDEEGRDAGTIVELDREARTLALRRGPSRAEQPLPQALIPGRPYDTDAQEDALERIGRSLLAGDGRYPAVESVLRRTPFPRDVQTTDLDEMAELVLGLDGRHLVIQGPPGSGKTWVSGRLIARLLAAGKRVGVASTSHKAIHKLLAEVEAAGIDVQRRQARERRQPRVVLRERAHRRASPSGTTASTRRSSAAPPGCTRTRTSTAGSTTCSSTRRARCRSRTRSRWARARGTSCSSATRSSSRRCSRARTRTAPASPCSSTCSATTRRSPPDRGLFLETTYRLHPDVCGYISDEFYEGRLVPDRALRRADDAVRDRAPLPAGRARRLPAGVGARGGARRGRGRAAAARPASRRPRSWSSRPTTRR